jgi:hypothetical protein
VEELTLNAALRDWTRFKPAREWLEHNAPPSAASVDASDEASRSAGSDQVRAPFREFLRQRQSSGADQSKNFDALFSEFQ